MGNKLQSALNVAFDTPAKKEPRPVPSPKRPKERIKVPMGKTKTSREGTVLVGAHVSPDVAKQLRMIAAEEGTTNKALIEEALDLLFKKKGVASIL
jgi:hypothetical protein